MCIHPPIIVIDGTAGSGKGTLAKRLSAHLHYGHLDTGKLYRAVAFLVIQHNIPTTDISAIVKLVDTISPEILENPQLADNTVGNMASSVVSRIQAVRNALLTYQRQFPKNCIQQGFYGAVLDGRDIGSVIFPNAPVKFFVTADVEIRAKRRYVEYAQLGKPIALETILNDLKSRDRRDMTAKVGRLVQTPDSILLDSSALDADEMMTVALFYVKKVYKSI